MAVILEKNLNKQNVAPGVDWAQGLRHHDAYGTFGKRMLDIRQIHEFANKYPEAFSMIMDRWNLHAKTLAVISDAPLGSFIKNGGLLIESIYSGEKRLLSIPERSLAKAGIDLGKQNPFLLINDGYVIKEEGISAFSVTIENSHLEKLGQVMKLLTSPNEKGWHKEIEGVPSGEASQIGYGLYYLKTKATAFGPLRRGYRFGYFDNVTSLVSIGDFRDSRSVLVQSATD